MRIGPGCKGLLLAGAPCLAFLLVSLSGCGEEQQGPTRPPDTTPPATTALQIDRVAPDSLKLSWSAPGGSGYSGRAAAYDLRYATFPFSDENWSEATMVAGLEAPGFPRTRETTVIRNMDPGQSYYISLRAVDAAGNWSGMSPLLIIAMPGEEGAPVLWGGRIVADAGTDQNAMIYQVREKLSLGASASPEWVPAVVISGVSHPMRLLEHEGTGDPMYEFDIKLPVGDYDFYFAMTNPAGQTARLPGPQGVWTGPAITTHRTFGLDFVRVEPDTFIMGNSASPDTLERPERTIVLTRPFDVDRFEVTNAQVCRAYNWALAQNLVGVEDDTIIVNLASGDPLLRVASRRDLGRHGIQYSAACGFSPAPFMEDMPATYITWFGAALYCNIRNWLEGLAPAYDIVTWESIPRRNPYGAEGWRLLTEAEWEFIAQHNDRRLYPTGNQSPRPGVEGNFARVAGGVTAVGSYPDGVNALGLRDLLGNVWEWCHDWKAPYNPNEIVDPVQFRARSSRVVRGGSWGSSLEELRCTTRFGQPPARAHDGLGFRCARTSM